MREASDAAGLHAFGVRFTGLTPAQQQAVDAVLTEFRRRAAVLLGQTG